MMEKEFVPYELALELKELKFDEPCFGLYSLQGSPNPVLIKGQLFTNTDEIEWLDSNECTAPLYQQAFRWFEKHYAYYVDRNVTTSVNTIMGIDFYVKSWKFPPIEIKIEEPYAEFTIVKSQNECLKKLIELAKKEKGL